MAQPPHPVFSTGPAVLDALLEAAFICGAGDGAYSVVARTNSPAASATDRVADRGAVVVFVVPNPASAAASAKLRWGVS